MAEPQQKKRITVPAFSAMKNGSAMKAPGQKITMLTAYDYAIAQLVDEADVEGILVDDSVLLVVAAARGDSTVDGARRKFSGVAKNRARFLAAGRIYCGVIECRLAIVPAKPNREPCLGLIRFARTP